MILISGSQIITGCKYDISVEQHVFVMNLLVHLIVFSGAGTMKKIGIVPTISILVVHVMRLYELKPRAKIPIFQIMGRFLMIQV